MNSLVYLYLSFCEIGFFSIGGGLVTLELIKEKIVNTNHWLTMAEFSDLVSISQMTPGPISLNASTFIGTKLAGLRGAIFSTLGNISPSILIVSILAFFYFKYHNLNITKSILDFLRPSSIGLILSAGISILILAVFGENISNLSFSKLDYISVVIFIIAFILNSKYKKHPLFIIAFSGLLGIVFYNFFV